MYDIFYLGVKDHRWDKIKSRYKKAQCFDRNISFGEIKNRAFTSMFWIIRDDLTISDEFDLESYKATKWDTEYVHVFKNGRFYDGLCLIPKKLDISNREFSHRFFINKKEIDIVSSDPVPYEKFYINSYDEYRSALETCSTDMFWAVWNDIEVAKDFKFDYYVPYYDQFHRNITHVFLNGSHYDGVCLFSKKTPVTKNEIEYRFFAEKKQVDQMASVPRKYDKFVISTYEDYQNAIKNSSTCLFWTVPEEVEIDSSFNFDFYTPERNYNHVFQHIFRGESTYNGVMLLTKKKPLSAKEINFRFLLEKKEHPIVASRLKPYDIIFISYNEPQADENFERLKKTFPRSQRVHGVKGIHQAHIEAARLSTTEMFWVVDGDAVIEEQFVFDYEVSRYELEIVHVWKSRNPINDLVYGYGGVKLLPKKLTLSMDVTSADMTTSISKWFKSMPTVSNSTQFNTDPYNTWKSAFRECVKLSSKAISGQIDKETEQRLEIWCTIGSDKNFGQYAIDGARAGKKYGESNKGDPESLKRINDFDWLKAEFEKYYA
jgi:exonuclease III